MTYKGDNMKTRKIALLLLAAGCIFTACKKYPAEYKIKDMYSIMLKNPDKAVDFARTSAEFWTKTYDDKNGGFFTMVARNGDVLGNNYKSTLSQSRIMYAFSRAYMLTGDKKFLKYANFAEDFIRTKCYDKEHGGFYTTVDATGRNIDFTYDILLNQNNRQREKWSFMQHYALLGYSALVDATRNEQHHDFLIKSRALLDEKLYDNRKGYEGYYESADYDWRNPRGKGFTPTMDCVTTHGLSLYLLTNDEKYKERLISLADNVITHMYPTSQSRKNGYEEQYDSEWRPREESFIFIGHMLKTAWCLQRANLISPKKEYSETAEKILHNINEKAWDNSNGGPYNFADSFEGVITNDNKNYWTLEQAITSGLINYYVTGNTLYLKMADEACGFFERYTIDKEYGDIFDEVKPDGKRLKTDEDEYKGSYWKSAYHSLETAYYIYLYGNLYFHRKNAALYYYIEKSSKNREFPMNPVEEIQNLIITKVELNGKDYTDFDSKKRILKVPANTEGEFRITYSISK